MLKQTNYPFNTSCQHKSNTYSRQLVTSIQCLLKYIQHHYGHHTLTGQKIKFSATKNISDETENFIKENQSYKNIVCIVYKGRMQVSIALLFF